jgi:Ca-activated chloride channel family protein
MVFKDFQLLHLLWGLVPVFFIYYRDERKRQKTLAQFGNSLTIDRLTKSVSWKKRRAQKGLELFGFLLIVITLARPSFGKSQEEVQKKGLEIVIAVDTSLSMLAEDYYPNRLAKAKQELIGLLDQLKGNRIGLVAFAGASITLCPLTLDTSTLKIYLDILDTQLIGIQGTDIGEVIRNSLLLFQKGKTFGKIIIFLTDGEDQGSQPLELAREALEMGVRIYTIGIGSEEGEPIPLTDESGNRIGHKRDEQGEVILTHLDEKTLKEISKITGGQYFKATSGEMEIERIFRDVERFEKGELGKSPLIQYEDRFQIPLLIALLSLMIGEFLGDRKGLFLKIRQHFLRKKAA